MEDGETNSPIVSKKLHLFTNAVIERGKQGGRTTKAKNEMLWVC